MLISTCLATVRERGALCCAVLLRLLSPVVDNDLALLLESRSCPLVVVARASLPD